MAKNASIFGFPDNPSTGTVVETFLLPLVYILIALLAMGGDMAIRYCVSRQELFQSPDRKRKIRNLEENDEASPGIVEVAENSLRFFQFKRSREKFNRVRKETFPPKSSKKLRTPYSAGRKVLYSKCRGTGMIRALRMAICLTCFAGFWSWVVILLRNISSKEDSNLNHHVTQFLAHSKALGKLADSIHTYVSVLFAYFAVRCLAQWTKVYNTCLNLDDKLVQMGFRVAAVFDSSSNELHVDMRWRMYRWLTSLNFLVLANSSAQMRSRRPYFILQLFDSGLLEEDEKMALESSQMPSKTLLRWIAQALSDHALTGAQPWLSRLRGVDDLMELKSAIVDVESVTLGNPNPLSWSQIMNFLVDIYLLFTPIRFLSSMYVPSTKPNSKESTDVQLWPLLATFLVSTFFCGLMETVAILRDPLGVDIDDFNVDYIWLRVERELLSLLGNADDDKLFSVESFDEENTKSFNPRRDAQMVHADAMSVKGAPRLGGISGDTYKENVSSRESIVGWRGDFANSQNPKDALRTVQHKSKGTEDALSKLKARYNASS